MMAERPKRHGILRSSEVAYLLCTTMSNISLDVLPRSNEEYGTREYWDARYSQEPEGTSFDWFKTYGEVSDLMHEYLPSKDARILMLGSGNSRLSQDMYDDGYKNIVNVDYSPVVIERMHKQHSQSRPEMEWLEMDVRKLDFEDSSFDVAIDKGTMDAMMTSKGDVWDPPEQVLADCNAEVSEVLRVLRPNGGTFIYVTFGQPHFRKRYLTRPHTELAVRELGEAFHYYLYVVKKE